MVLKREEIGKRTYKAPHLADDLTRHGALSIAI